MYMLSRSRTLYRTVNCYSLQLCAVGIVVFLYDSCRALVSLGDSCWLLFLSDSCPAYICDVDRVYEELFRDLFVNCDTLLGDYLSYLGYFV